ncbi:hypothetical protein [Mesobacillus jeotgali]|uniref:GH3 auxin-responsive promoter n=1 Tax=Mesobacillus jeotgali TaxID=129985 RepID=A0ABY9VHY4_9BACI|nr:hypothetical protein [Mesobacillus jeotgali]WNF21317.1 hypothetical protein RH061_14045 [Mesobacillus jeotgali]
MSIKSFAAVNNLYEISKDYRLHFHRLEHLDLRNFSNALTRLEKVIFKEELAEEPILHDLISGFRKYRFFSVSSLLSFKECNSFLETGKLKLLYKRCCNLFPNILDELRICYAAFDDLVRSVENPILEYIEQKIRVKPNTGILLKGTPDYESTIRGFKKSFSQSTCKLIGPQILKTNTFFEQIIIIGPSRWFPSYIYNSPHAPVIHTITYKWLEQKFYEAPPLAEIISAESSIFSGRTLRFDDQFSVTNVMDDIVLDTNIERTIDYGFVEKHMNLGQLSLFDNEEENVEAKLVFLSGGKGIFLESLPVKNIFSIYSDSDGFTVGKVSINELEQGSYILIRTGTKQDLIRIKADEIIGTGALTFRKFNLKWKNRLKKLVVKNGIEAVQRALKKLGVKNPVDTNIRNWVSEETIMPALESDFKAILKFVKLQDEESKHIKVAKLLRKAHLDAGKLIRAKLVTQIKSTDLSALELKGEHLFNLPDEKDVSFTAFRVEFISDQQYKLPISKLREIIAV